MAEPTSSVVTSLSPFALRRLDMLELTVFSGPTSTFSVVVDAVSVLVLTVVCCSSGSCW